MKKYYWLKLKRDFFKSNDIQIIEAMPNGKDYILFYLKLLVESISHEGNLRFSESIPYNDQMLATITNTNVDIVRSAVKIFSELHMIEIMDDGTLFMNHVQSMIGDETEWAEKKRIYRMSKRAELGQKKTLSDKSIEKELELELDKELEKEYIPSAKATGNVPTKKVKTKFGEFGNVTLTADEYEKLKAEYNGKTEGLIKYLDEYKERKGYKTKSDYLTIRGWVQEAYAKTAPQSNQDRIQAQLKRIGAI